MTPTSDTSPTVVTDQAEEAQPVNPWTGWRFWVALGVWTAVVAGFLLGLATFWQGLGIGIGHLWGPPSTPDDWIGVWSTFVGIVIGLTVVAIVAAVARRWVALVLALLIAAAAGFFAVGLFHQVRPIVAPVEHVDPGPAPCACYSGSFCDCPGG